MPPQLPGLPGSSSIPNLLPSLLAPPRVPAVLLSVTLWNLPLRESLVSTLPVLAKLEPVPPHLWNPLITGASAPVLCTSPPHLLRPDMILGLYREEPTPLSPLLTFRNPLNTVAPAFHDSPDTPPDPDVWYYNSVLVVVVPKVKTYLGM